MINLEPVVYILRGDPNMKDYGDAFTFVATLIREHDKILVKGAVGVITMEMKTALFKQLKEMGINTVVWERIKRGRVKAVEIKI